LDHINITERKHSQLLLKQFYLQYFVYQDAIVFGFESVWMLLAQDHKAENGFPVS